MSNWKNVNNWHWIEKDCAEWSHQEIKSRLTGLIAGNAKIIKVNKVSGDVSVSQRKGRLRYLFDLAIDFTWSLGDEIGLVEIRDFMSDTDKKGFEFYVRSSADDGCTGPVSNGAKESISTALQDAVWDTLQNFADDLVQAHGQALLVPQSNETPSESTEADANVSEVLKEFKQASGIPTTDLKSKNLNKKDWKTEIIFQASPEDLFESLTVPQKVQLWSRSPLVGSLASVGSPFSLFSGAVTGRVLECKPEIHSIKWAWKLADWAGETEVSLNIVKDAETGNAKLSLLQTAIPADQYEMTTQNWAKYYWDPIKATFGYGAFLQY